MKTRIKWPPNEDHFDNLGSNGYVCSAGVAVTRVGDQIAIEGIDSRGHIARVRVMVPVNQIDAVIAALQAVKSG